MRATSHVYLAFLALLALGLVALAPAPPVPVEGLVLADDGPVVGARVRVQATAALTWTDAHGHFRLPERTPGRRVTAAHPGYFISGTPFQTPLTFQLRRLPPREEDNTAYAWVDPAPGPGRERCGNCHAELYEEWAGSGHARSATGRHFRNLYEGTDWLGRPDRGWSLLRDHKDGATVCALCHAPALPEADPAALEGLTQLRGVAAAGVHCDYCHKIADVTTRPGGLTFGSDAIRLLRPSEGQIFFGPLDDVDRGDDVYSPLYRESRYCTPCHEGTVFGVPVYTTYSEWLDSPARSRGVQCQGCHTAPTGRLTNLAPGHGGRERDPHSLGNHSFFAGSLAEMLRRAVTLEATAVREGPHVRLSVTVRADGAGHRVPTGFIDRHLLLVIDGQDKAGRPLAPFSGPTLPAVAGPELAGRAGYLYAKWLRDPSGTRAVPFWDAFEDPVDTRLTPGQADARVFLFPAELSRGRVRLLYRRFWDSVRREKGWPDRDLLVGDRTVAVPP